MICKHKRTKLNGFKYFLCTRNNSIKRQSFVYTRLNDLFYFEKFNLA